MKQSFNDTPRSASCSEGPSPTLGPCRAATRIDRGFWIHLAGATALALTAGGCPRASAGELDETPRGTPIKDIYQQWPSYESAMQGQFSTGALLADINGDGYPDLVVSNGNDMSPQPLVVYFNQCDEHRKSGCFGRYPDYYSADSDYLGTLAIGDIDHDGWPDVAVAVPFDKHRATAGGGVKIYMNKHGQLEPLPSQRLGQSGVFECALADVNADGRLDLVVPGFSLPPASDAPVLRAVSENDAPDMAEPVRIYLNEGERFATKPAWESRNKMIAFGVTVADLDQDGWMDLAVAGVQTFVYHGGPPAPPDAVPIDPTPAWISEKDGRLALFVDAGHIGADSALTLAVSRGCLPNHKRCLSDFALYRPGESRKPVWISKPAYQSSMPLLADLNDDGLLELVGGQWGDEIVGEPLWVFQGRPGGYHTQPDFTTAAAVPNHPISGLAVAEALAVGDTRRCDTSSRTLTWTAARTGAIITLVERQVASVESVEVAGRALPARDWAFASGNNWISLAHPYAAGDTVRVSYVSSPVQDVVEATWNPQRGNLIYNSFLRRGRCR
jgi:hypothetical protein